MSGLRPEDKRALRYVAIIVAGFLTGLILLFYIIATDL